MKKPALDALPPPFCADRWMLNDYGSARVMKQRFYDLDRPVARLCTAEVPISYVTGIWNSPPPPQVAIVGFDRITEQPWAENGRFGVRPFLHATLAGDHRATDGRTGARFLDALNRQFQHPESR